MSRNTVTRQWVAGLLLVLFSFYYANVSLFSHSHIINGTTIVHSHIHVAHHHDTPSGDHTSSSLELINTLNEFLTLEAVNSYFDFSVYTVQQTEQVSLYTAEVYTTDTAVQLLRAPPVA